MKRKKSPAPGSRYTVELSLEKDTGIMNSDQFPYITLNMAMTADGKTDTVERQGARISSPQDAERVDRLRAESDAVMVGGHTLLVEDPRLTVKSEALRAERRARGTTDNPIKVGVVTKADLKPDSRFLNQGPALIKIFTTEQTEPEQIERLRSCGAQVFIMGVQRVDLNLVLSSLKRDGINRLMIEGGGTLNAELLKLGLVDEIYLYIAPLIFGGATAPTPVDGIGISHKDAIRLELIKVEETTDSGILVHYWVMKRMG